MLEEAWRRVERYRGAASMETTWLSSRRLSVSWDELGAALRAVRIVRSRFCGVIPKADGRQRPLGIPMVRDRVAHGGAPRSVLEPIFEADSALIVWVSAERSATQARKPFAGTVTWGESRAGREAPPLLRQHRRREAAQRWRNDLGSSGAETLRQWLAAGVPEEGQWTATLAGTPQGGVIRPCCPISSCMPRPGVGGSVGAPRHAGPLRRRLVVMRDDSRGRGARQRVRAVLTRLGLEHIRRRRERSTSRAVARASTFWLSPAQAHERSDLGVEAGTCRSPASVAVTAREGAGARACASADALDTLSRGSPPRDRGREPVLRGGEDPPHGQRGGHLHPDRHRTSRTGCAALLQDRAGRGSAPGRPTSGPSLLRNLGTAAARDDSVSGGGVMRRPERDHLVSRVREICMHHLKRCLYQ